MSDPAQAPLATVNAIAQERRSWVWRIAFTALCVVIIGAVIAFSWVDFQAPLSPATRWIAWAAIFGVGLYFLRKNRRQISEEFTPAETARAMEAARPEVGQKVRTAFEMAQRSDGEESHGFRDQLVSETEEFLSDHDWKPLIPRGRGVRWILAFATLAIGLLISTMVWPEFGLGVKRILIPGTNSTYTQLAWENPPEWFDQRHPPLAQLKVSGREAEPKLFVKEDESEEWETIVLNPRDNSSVWDAVLAERTRSLTAYAAAGDGKTQTIRIEYEPIPELREVSVALEFPDYIERENETRNGGDVRALEGTRATWTFVFNTAPAEVKWEIGQAIPELLPSAEVCVSATHAIQAGIRNPVLTVTDRRGRPVDSWRFEVEGLVDALPEIEILEPAKDRDATTITEIPVRIRASDDYGLGEVGVVLEAVGETKWILEKVIDTNNQRQANEMVSAMLEEIPLEITDNVRLYAYALDRKPRGGPRALSHLRSIDIRQFKRRWKFKKAPPGPKLEREDLVGLEKIIGKQRAIVSQVFVLKGGGRDSISQELVQKCNGEAAKEDALSLDVEALVGNWLESGRVAQDDITLLEVAGEQMIQAGKVLRVPNRDSAFEIADQSLSNLLRLRKRLLNLIMKGDSEGEPMDPKEQPPMLTKLAQEARRLAREEADVRRQVEDEDAAKSTSPEITRRQQDVAIYDAGELYSELLIHPEKTEGALDLMDEAEKAMLLAGQKLQSDADMDAVPDLAMAEQRLFELAEFLLILAMQMASEALEELASELEKEAEELAEKSDSEGESESQSESDQGEEGETPEAEEGEKPGGKLGESESTSSEKGESSRNGEGEGDDKSEDAKADGKSSEKEVAEQLAKAGRRARLTEEVLKALADREAGKGGGEEGENDGEGKDAGKSDELENLREGLGLGELAEALQALAETKNGKGETDENEGADGKGNPESEKDIAKLAGQLSAAGKKMRELARELNSSQLAQLAEVKEEIGNLKRQLETESESSEGEGEGAGGKGEEENPFAALLAGDGGDNPDSESSEKDSDEPNNYRQGRHGVTRPTTIITEKLERLEDETVRIWGGYLSDTPFDRSMIPVLEAIEKRVDELVGEIPQISAVAGGRRSIPEESRREVEDYFRDLSDDFGSEEWLERK